MSVQEVCRQASELLRAGDKDINSPSGRKLRVSLLFHNVIDALLPLRATNLSDGSMVSCDNVFEDRLDAGMCGS